MISAADLQQLPHKTIQVQNAHTGASETYQGVELSLLLTRVDAPLAKNSTAMRLRRSRGHGQV
jgi:hypothetical protein